MTSLKRRLSAGRTGEPRNARYAQTGTASKPRNAVNSLSPLDKEAWLRVAEEWLMLAQSNEESRRRRSGDS
jgi:hypothetical protein